MVISSRTPEGSPNRCPVCGYTFRIEPSQPFGDAPCPACGQLLWFVHVGENLRFYDPDRTGFVEHVANRLGIPTDTLRAGRWEELAERHIDSLGLVELVMELEELNGNG